MIPIPNHALRLEADAGTRTPDPLLTMERHASTEDHASPSYAETDGPPHPAEDPGGQDHAAHIRPTTERELADALAGLAILGLVELRQDDAGDIRVDPNQEGLRND